MKRILTMLPYWGVIALGFYALPLLMQDTEPMVVMLLILFPLLCLASGIIYGIFNGFEVLYPLVVALLFAPTLFIFYNLTAWIYVAVYFLVALIGVSIGFVVNKIKNRKPSRRKRA